MLAGVGFCDRMGGPSAAGISNAIARDSNCKIVYPGESVTNINDWLDSTDYREIVLMPGEYIIDESIVPKSNAVIRGTGDGTILNIIGDHSASPFSAIHREGTRSARLENITIKDLTINGSAVTNGHAIASKGIFITYCDSLRIENVTVIETPATGIGSDFLRKSVITNCITVDCGSQTGTGAGSNGIGVAVGGSADESLVIDSCIAVGSGNNGIMLEHEAFDELDPDSYAPTDFVISNCITQGSGRAGFAFEGTSGAILTGCVSDGDNYGVAFTKSSGDGVADYPAGTLIDSCKLLNSTIYGIWGGLYYGEEMTVQGTEISGAGSHGVYFQSGNGLSFSNSYIHNCTSNGFWLKRDKGTGASDLNNVQIIGCKILNNGSDETNVSGVFIYANTGDLSGFTITNNIIGNTSGGTYQDYGINLYVSTYYLTNFQISGNSFIDNAITGITWNTTKVMENSSISVKDNQGFSTSQNYTANNDIPALLSGYTITNLGASGAIALDCPEAVVGRTFRFIDAVNTATVDLYIDCESDEHFVKPDGTPMADGERYGYTSDAFAAVTATCYLTGVWQLENEIGTGTEEEP